MAKTVKEWLLRIADAVANWKTMDKDSVEVAMSVETPRGVVEYSLSTIPDAEERGAVRRALPSVTTDDFAIEARKIREAAEKL